MRHFAVLRERRGVDAERLVVEPGTTVGELYRRLFPPGPEGTLPVMYAVNLSYARPDQVLSEGDEVAFVPPLGGG